ncbi:MAG: nucleoid occlusion protein [Eubacteriales bacterium]|nr:nucleoid occlusion protein [Eubacteriales bacterium]
MPRIEIGRERSNIHDKLLTQIPVSDIRPNPSQPRATFDEESIRELAQSIAAVGLIQPLVVRRAPDGYELVAGERRLRAVKLLGMDRVACIVQDMMEEQSAMIALIENLQREDLYYMEEAQCYETLLKTYNMTQEALAERLGKSQSAIANKLRLLKLAQPVKDAMQTANLTERHARALLKLRNEEEQLAVIKRIGDKSLSVKETEKLVDKTLDTLYDSRADGARPRPVIVRMVKDYRLFMNTINLAVEQLREAGFAVEISQADITDGVDIGIRVKRPQ